MFAVNEGGMEEGKRIFGQGNYKFKIHWSRASSLARRQLRKDRKEG